MDTEFLKYVFFKNQIEDGFITYYKLQASIIDKLEKHNFAMCFDEVGLGKTVQGIYAIWNILQKKKQHEFSKILVVASNERLANKWQQEIKKFLGLSFKIVDNKSGFYPCFNPECDNFFITYNSSNYNDLGLGKLTSFSSEIPVSGYWDVNHVMSHWQESFFNSSDKSLRSLLFVDKPTACDIEEVVNQAYCDESEYAPIDKERLICDSLLYKGPCTRKYICRTDWDLMILDEADSYYENYKKALFRERIEMGSGRNATYYPEHFAWHKTKQVLVLTATPLKNDSNEKQFKNVMNFPKKLLIDPKNDITVEIEHLLKFNIDIPYQRYFKEVVLGVNDSKTRNVIFLKYSLTDNLRYIWHQVNESPYKECCNVFLLIKKFIIDRGFNDECLSESYMHYTKEKYDGEDILS